MSRSVVAIALALPFWMGALAPQAFAQQAGDGRVGTAAAVRGTVQLAALGPAPTTIARQVGTVVTSGSPLFLGDAIESGPGAGLQILLADETVFTIGPDAQLTIDEFVYSPAGGAGRLTATVARGAFRMISGKVAAAGPDAMRVRTPVATIGIRGTMVGGEVSPRGETFVVLLGPGTRAMDEGQRVGRIAVFANSAPPSQAIEITRAGFGTTVSAPNIPPPPPVRIEQARIQQLGAALQSRGQPAPAAATPAAQPAQGGGQAAPAPQPQAQGGGQAAPGPQQPGQAEPSGAAPQGSAQAPSPPPGAITPMAASFAPPLPPSLGAAVGDLGSAIRLAVQQANSQQVDTRSTSSASVPTNASFTLPASITDPPVSGFDIRAAIPQSVIIPMSIQLQWAASQPMDLDLHMTVPTLGGGREHVFFGNPVNLQNNFSTGSGTVNVPLVRLGNDVAGLTGSEVMVIDSHSAATLASNLSSSADRQARVSVVHFDAAAGGITNSTSLSNISNATVKVITGGTYTIGSSGNGDKIVGGTTRGTFTVPTGQTGNTWIVLEANPVTRVVTPIGQMTNITGCSSSSCRPTQ